MMGLPLSLTFASVSTFLLFPFLFKTIEPNYFSQVGELEQVSQLKMTDNHGWSDMKITWQSHQLYQARWHDKSLSS